VDPRESDRVCKLLDEFKAGRISRRQFLRLAIGGSTTVLAATVAACRPALTPEPVAAPTEPAAPTPTAVLEPTATPKPAIEPKVLIFAGGQDVPTIDPSDRTDYSISCMNRMLYDTLWWQVDFPPRLAPRICTSYEGSEDATEWILHLTDKAVFHDGTPVTAEAVQFSFNRTLRFQKPMSIDLLPIMDENSVQVVDDRTVKITLTAPFAELPWVLNVQAIMNPKVVKEHDKAGDEGAEWLIEHEAGSGPFVIKRWEPGTLYEVEAVPDYWGGWPGKGRPAGVIWRIIRDSAARRMALLAGEIDCADTVAVDDIALIEEAPGYHAGVDVGYLTGYVKLNNQIEPFNDVNFRKFLAYAYDYEALITLRGGEQYGPLLIGCLPSGVPGHDPNVKPVYRHDPEKASECLNKTKWTEGGIELDFVYVTGLEFEEQMGLVLLEALAEYNIKVNMVAKVWPDMVAMSVHPETGADMICVFVDQGVIASRWFRYQWYSGFWDRPEGGSYQSASFYTNPKVDALVEKAEVTVDEEKRMEMITELQRLVMEDIPELMLFTMPNILGFSDRVKGYSYTGRIAPDFWPMWIEEA